MANFHTIVRGMKGVKPKGEHTVACYKSFQAPKMLCSIHIAVPSHPRSYSLTEKKG